uniref:C2H2-type domain-containing protein n=1 Tax=Takifugu rubripes TaxID=31033 RepID=A0A674MIZ5_TAKRU
MDCGVAARLGKSGQRNKPCIFKYNQTDLQDFRPDEFNVPVASTSQVQDGRESQQTTAKFMDHIQADDNQSSFSTSREAAVVQFCSAASDFHCHLCDKPFSSNQFLINHAFHFHSRNADVLCAVCGKTLESTESLIAHINSHKGPKCCHICGKHCNSTTSLKEHVASHAGVKLHCCPLCGKECGRKGDLKIHMRIHTGEKPFCCSYCCKSFTHSGHLKKHLGCSNLTQIKIYSMCRFSTIMSQTFSDGKIYH